MRSNTIRITHNSQEPSSTRVPELSSSLGVEKITSANQEKLKLFYDNLPLGMEIPIVINDGRSLKLQWELHPSFYDGYFSMQQEVAHKQTELKQLFPEHKIYATFLIIDAKLLSSELHLLRTLKLQFPDIVGIKEKENHSSYVFEYLGGGKNQTKIAERLRSQINSFKEFKGSEIIEHQRWELDLSQDIFTDHEDILKAFWASGCVDRFGDLRRISLDRSKQAPDLLVQFEGLTTSVKERGKARNYLLHHVAMRESEINETAINIEHDNFSRLATTFALKSLPHSIKKLPSVLTNNGRATVFCLIDEVPVEQERKKITKALSEISSSPDIIFIPAHDLLSAKLFSLVPHEWGFRSCVLNKENGSVLLNCSNSPSEKYEIHLNEISEEVGFRVFLPDNSFKEIDLASDLASSIFSHAPCGIGIHTISQNLVDESVLIKCKNEIDPRKATELSRFLGLKIIFEKTTSQYTNSSISERVLSKLAQAPALFKGNSQVFHKSSITAYGACGQVSGSAFHLKIGNCNLLLDCGINFDKNSVSKIPDEVIRDLDYIIVSHAHADHVGGLIDIYSRGCKAKILATETTLVLSEFVIAECLKRDRDLRQKTSGTNIYHQILSHACPVRYDINYNLTDSVAISLHPAGHLLGSSMIEINHAGKKILYTGDLNGIDTRLHSASVIREADILIIESTYGAKISENRENIHEKFKTDILTTLDNGGIVLAPVLALGRSQEVLSLLYEMRENIKKQRKKPFDVYIDGTSSAINKTYGYYRRQDRTLFSLTNQENLNWMDQPESHFKPVSKEKRDVLFSSKSPKVITTTSGMVEGLAKQYFYKLRNNSNNLLALTCFQVPGSFGSSILDGKINCDINVKRYALSAHNDQQATLDFIKGSKPKCVFLVHGEPHNSIPLKKKIDESEINTAVEIMRQGLNYSLEIN